MPNQHSIIMVNTEEEDLSPTSRSSVLEQDDELKEKDGGCPWSWLKWCPTSRLTLRKAEEELLSSVSTPITFGNVAIGQFDSLPSEPVKIWTAVMNEDSSGTAIVLIHGFASGLGLWALNLDGLAKYGNRPVYAFDLPGFGQSSRPIFSNDPEKAEEEFVMYIEAWREKVGLETMIMVGHSMGAFLVFSYALKYPERVAHMILADPWGIKPIPKSLSELEYIPPAQRILVSVLGALPLNPLWHVRLMGPLGSVLIKKVRMDLISNFVHSMEDAPTKVANYIFHCNVQKPLTGEYAYRCMMITFGWAKRPLSHRLHLLHPDVPMTLVYGSRSWMDHYPAEKIRRTIRPSSYVGYNVIVAGHHVYADSPETFNLIVLDACKVEQQPKKVSVVPVPAENEVPPPAEPFPEHSTPPEECCQNL